MPMRATAQPARTTWPASRALGLLGLSLWLLAGCAGQRARPDPDANHDTAPVAALEDTANSLSAEISATAETMNVPLPPEQPVDTRTTDPCAGNTTGDTWLDKTQRGIGWTVCGTARWFDGFFGDRSRYEATITETNGRLGAFGYYDQRNGFDPDYRFRVKLALPTAKRRAKLLFGRGDDRQLIEERGTNDADTLPNRFETVQDTTWLLGLGYQKGGGLKKGFDTSVGVQIRNPPDPYGKLRYFRNWALTDETLFRWRQTAFWTQRRGFGTTTNIDLDVLLSERFMTRFANAGTVAEDRDGLDWNSSLTLYQSLSNRRALSYRAFVFGLTGAPESLNNYGLELRFRRRILRSWLFVEFLGSVSWPKYLPEEPRELNPGAGIGFDMYFGPVPDEQLR